MTAQAWFHVACTGSAFIGFAVGFLLGRRTTEDKLLSALLDGYVMASNLHLSYRDGGLGPGGTARNAWLRRVRSLVGDHPVFEMLDLSRERSGQ